MRKIGWFGTTSLWAGAAVVVATGIANLRAQGPEGGRTAQALFNALDTDQDGTLTRAELESGFHSWFTAWNNSHSGTLTQPEIAGGLTKVLPAPPAVKPGQAGTFNPVGNSTPIPVAQAAVDAMMAALPTTPGAKPLRRAQGAGDGAHGHGWISYMPPFRWPRRRWKH